MSIAPPSDIILDVAQAADPQRLKAATVKLNSLAAASGSGASGSGAPGSTASGSGAPAVDFHSLLASAAATSSAARSSAGPAPLSAHAGTVSAPMSPYRKFEAVLLQTFVQEILPKDDNLFGDAASADACRSMLAEQLAGQLAKSGRIGIAKMIEKAHGPQGAAAPAATSAPAVAAAASAVEGAAAPILDRG